MTNNTRMSLLLASVLAVAGCGFDTAPEDPDGTDQTGLTISVDTNSAEYVDGIQFDIETCGGEEVVSEQRELSQLEFDEGLDVEVPRSAPFANYSRSLPPGCYDAGVTPVDESGEVIDRCMPAEVEGIEVEAGRTTEIAVVSRCGEG